MSLLLKRAGDTINHCLVISHLVINMTVLKNYITMLLDNIFSHHQMKKNMRGQICTWKIIAACITTNVGLRYKLSVTCSSSSSCLRLTVNAFSCLNILNWTKIINTSILPREATLIRTAVRWESIISVSNSSWSLLHR